MIASAVVHGLVFAALYAVGAPEEPSDDSFVVEIDVAPMAPEAFDPPEQGAQVAAATTVAKTEPAPAPEPEPEPEPPPEPEPEPEPAPAALDAGVPPVDAASQIAEADAAVSGDAGLLATDQGADAGVGAGDHGTATSTGPVGVGLDLAPLTPAGDHLAVLIRFDRLRGTDWAPRAEKVLAPMPDYRMIVGRRDVSIADRFDLLLISSSDPRDVTATNLAGKTRLGGAELRAFLDHPEVPVSWKAARGGALGTIGPSRLINPADHRVYLTPMPQWIVLADKKLLGGLAEPSAADLDAHPAAEALPDWLRRLPGIVELTGSGEAQSDGPAVAVSLRGLPEIVDIPLVGRLPAPRHLTLALEIQPLGFVVRGTMEFASAERAAQFVATVETTKKTLLDSRLSATALRRLHVFHAARGLSVRQKGARVSYATSISVADARAALDLAAEQTRRWYARQRPATPPR